MSSQQSPKEDIPTIKVKIGFSEGLNFGCGFFVAGFLFVIVAVPLAAMLISVAGYL